MYPYLEIFGKTIPSYGLMAALGCLITFGFVYVICPKFGAIRDNEFYLMAFVAVFAVIGAKLLYQIFHLSELWTYKDTIFASLQSFIKYFGSGFVFYGGLIGGGMGVIAYARYFKENTVGMTEAFVLGVPLFHAFGRIGCFLSGCCYGIPYDGPLSVTFQNAVGGPNGVPLLPIQLIEAGINIAVFIILLCFARKPRKPLQILALYLMLYSVERFVLEFFRGDLVRGVFWNISTSQWISLILLPIGIYLFVVKPEKNFLARRVLHGDLPAGRKDKKE